MGWYAFGGGSVRRRVHQHRDEVARPSFDQRIGKASYDLDEVGLTLGPGLVVQPFEMRLDRALGYYKDRGNLGHATDLDYAEQDAQFGWG